MSESLASPKKHLALDTDWMSGVVAAFGFFICALLGVGIVWTTVRGTFHAGLPSWRTALLAAGFIWLGARESDRSFRILMFSLAGVKTLRLILWLSGASNQTLVINEVLARWIESGLYLAICVYVAYWFKTKIRYV
jgi:phosphatidylserine synthase